MKDLTKYITVVLLLLSAASFAQEKETTKKEKDAYEKSWKTKKYKKDWKSKKYGKTSSMSANEVMKALDANNDGKISKEEASAKSEYKMFSKKFDYIDTNEDGALDEKELKQKLEKNYSKDGKKKKNKSNNR